MTFQKEELPRLPELLKDKAYPGRGIFIGMTDCGNYAVIAYFIMGRSSNSQNRVFRIRDNDLFTEPYKAELVEDPSLIIYRALSADENRLIVTNGDQTDTILDFEKQGKSFDQALLSRTFEPDKPNWTPRISGICRFEDELTYELSILKASDPQGQYAQKNFYRYQARPGVGHFISTYEKDGSPLPSFEGDPRPILLSGPRNQFGDEVWQALNPANKVALYIRFIELKTGKYDQRIFNKKEESND